MIPISCLTYVIGPPEEREDLLDRLLGEVREVGVLGRSQRVIVLGVNTIESTEVPDIEGVKFLGPLEFLEDQEFIIAGNVVLNTCGHVIIHGSTSNKSGLPEILSHCISIGTNPSRTGRLCMAKLDPTSEQIEFIAAEGKVDGHIELSRVMPGVWMESLAHIEAVIDRDARMMVEGIHTGGANGVRGRDFERWCAQHLIIRLAYNCLECSDEGHATFIYEQIFGFVDDLFISHHGNRVFYQCKHVTKLYWSELRGKIDLQIELISAAPGAGRISIIVSSEDVFRGLCEDHDKRSRTADGDRARALMAQGHLEVLHIRPVHPVHRLGEDCAFSRMLRRLCVPFVDESVLKRALNAIAGEFELMGGGGRLSSLMSLACAASRGEVASLVPASERQMEACRLLNGIQGCVAALRGNLVVIQFDDEFGSFRTTRAGSDSVWAGVASSLCISPPTNLLELRAAMGGTQEL